MILKNKRKMWILRGERQSVGFSLFSTVKKRIYQQREEAGRAVKSVSKGLLCRENTL